MNRIRTILLAAGAVLMTGCTLLPQRPPQPAVHDFGQTGLRAAVKPPPWSAVRVAAPEWLQEPVIRYRLLYAEPTRVRFYSLARWAAPPPELFASFLGASRTASGWELRIDLQAFEQVFEQPNRSAVLLQFHAEVIDPVTGAQGAERNFRFLRTAASADAAGAVQAFSRVADEAARELSGWVENLPNPRPGQGS